MRGLPSSTTLKLARVGVNMNNDPTLVHSALISDAGFRAERYDLSRESWETGGQPAILTARLAAAAAAGQQVIPILIQDKSRERATFPTYCVTAVSANAGKGYRWEIWNEPHDPNFFNTVSGVEFAALCRAVKAALVAAGLGDEKLITGGCIPAIGSSGAGADGFVRDMVQGGAVGPGGCDYFGVHSYVDINASYKANIAAGFTQFQAIMNRANRIVPFMMTEAGFSTSTAATLGVSQAQLMRDMFDACAPYAETAIWYRWAKTAGESPTYGLFDMGASRPTALYTDYADRAGGGPYTNALIAALG